MPERSRDMPNAIRFHKSGGPEVLVWEPVPIGKPGPGEARVRHTAVGVNFVDIYIRTGLYPAALPSGLGTEAAGIQKGCLFFTRPTLNTYAAARADLSEMAKDLFGVVLSGGVKIEIKQTYPLKDAAQAHRDLESRKTVGSTVLTV